MTTKKCAALYNHVHIRPGGKVYPCCRFKKQLMDFDGNFNTVLHSKEYVELRERFEKEEIPECQKCWDHENAGIQSERQVFNEKWNCEEIKLRELWIGIDNLCNLKCVMCNKEYSNQFTGEVISTKVIKSIPDIDKVVFLGGEPLMNERYFRLLRQMNRSILHLTIITNGMFKLQDKWKELLRECKHVAFFVSVDACGELCERVREGSKWETVVETVEDLETEWPVTINTVIHKDNVKGIDDLKKWIDKRPWQINILTFPTHLRVSSDDKQRITRNFNQYFTYTI